MKKILMKTALPFVVCGLAGCSSIVSKSQYPVTISSNPTGANIEVMTNGNIIYSGQTPAHLVLNASAGYFKKAIYSVKLSQKGYETQVFQIEPSVDGWYAAGNLGFGFIIGWLIVDPLTGSMYKLDETYAFSLSKSKTDITLMTLDKVPEAWKAHLKPLSNK